MSDQPPTAVQAQVRAPCARQVAPDLQGSAMTDQGLWELTVRTAGPASGRRV